MVLMNLITTLTLATLTSSTGLSVTKIYAKHIWTDPAYDSHNITLTQVFQDTQ